MARAQETPSDSDGDYDDFNSPDQQRSGKRAFDTEEDDDPDYEEQGEASGNSQEAADATADAAVKPARKARAPRAKLMKWDEEDIQKALLGICFACSEAKLRIPWEVAAKFVDEHCSGNALQQAIWKLRVRREHQGLSVPPPFRMASTKQTPGLGVNPAVANAFEVGSTNGTESPITPSMPKNTRGGGAGRGRGRGRGGRSAATSKATAAPGRNASNVAKVSNLGSPTLAPAILPSSTDKTPKATSEPAVKKAKAKRARTQSTESDGFEIVSASTPINRAAQQPSSLVGQLGSSPMGYNNRAVTSAADEAEEGPRSKRVALKVRAAKVTAMKRLQNDESHVAYTGDEASHVQTPNLGREQSYETFNGPPPMNSNGDLHNTNNVVGANGSPASTPSSVSKKRRFRENSGTYNGLPTLNTFNNIYTNTVASGGLGNGYSLLNMDDFHALKHHSSNFYTAAQNPTQMKSGTPSPPQSQSQHQNTGMGFAPFSPANSSAFDNGTIFNGSAFTNANAFTNGNAFTNMPTMNSLPNTNTMNDPPNHPLESFTGFPSPTFHPLDPPSLATIMAENRAHGLGLPVSMPAYDDSIFTPSTQHNNDSIFTPQIHTPSTQQNDFGFTTPADLSTPYADAAVEAQTREEGTGGLGEFEYTPTAADFGFRIEGYGFGLEGEELFPGLEGDGFSGWGGDGESG